MLKPAIEKPTHGAITLQLALANAAAAQGVAFGLGQPIDLARVGDGDAAPEWAPMFPAGPEIVARDGRRWTLEDPAVVVEAFKTDAQDRAFDINHVTEIQGPEGGEAPAQGWIKELAVREDGSVWARVDWTADGAAHLAAKRYRYVSPAFEFDETTRAIKRVTSAALVTHPALVMPAIAGRDRRKSPEPQETPMTTIALATAAAALGLASTSTEAEVLSILTANAQAAKDLKDPTKFVPAADLAAALTRATTAEGELATLKTETADAKALASVEAAIADGKITPATKDHWLSVAKAAPDGFATAMASMPKIAGSVSQTEKKREGVETDDDGLTADQRALCSQNGWDPKAFAATLKETN